MTAPPRKGRTLIGSTLLPVAVVVFTAIFGTLSAHSDAANAQDVSGSDLYAANCAGCHQPGGEGIVGTFPPLAGNPAAADPTYVATVVSQGKSGPIEVLGVPYDGVMPPFSKLSTDEIAAIADHVSGLATGTAPDTAPDTAPTSVPDGVPTTTVPPEPPVAGDADRGRELFVGSNRLDRGAPGCASCHVAGDVGNLGGNGLGPDLTGVYGRLGGEAGLTAWLANPASKTMMPVFADRPMTDQEIADLVAFLADTPNSERPSYSADWLLMAGLAGLGMLLIGMAIAWRGMRRPYAQILATTRRSPR